MNGEAEHQQDHHTSTEGMIWNQWGSAAAGWRRWEPYFMASSWPVSLRMLLDLHLESGMGVLDVGCGIGDPALPIAFAVGSTGRVLALDMAEEMVEVAVCRAAETGIENVEFKVAALEELDHSGDRFDAVSARFSLMFLVDIPRGLAKLFKLLRPGGRIAVAVWGSTDVNRMFGIPREVIGRHADSPEAAADAPGPMRLSEEGELQRELEAAGFVEVRVTDVKFYNFARNAAEYFDMIYDTGLSFRRSFDELSDDKKLLVRQELMVEVAKHTVGGVIRVPAMARVGTGRRPAR